ncbi:MAG: TIGR03905 family TSCPD domain-containing protein [Bilophila wadsworthia]
MAIAPLMGVCSSALQYDITDDGRVTGIRFAGGCPGNLEAVARLAEGLPAEAVISRLEGIQCGSKPTSCPDQLARALKRELAARGVTKRGGRKELKGSSPPSNLFPFY